MSLDIDVFFSKYRSIFDHIARIIRIISLKLGISPHSFSDLRNKWIVKQNHHSLVGSNLANFVLSCDWFDLPAGIRDLITHNGAETVPSYENNGMILLQVYHKEEMKILSPQFGVVDSQFMDFEVLGLYIGYLIGTTIKCQRCGVRLSIVERLKRTHNDRRVIFKVSTTIFLSHVVMPSLRIR